MKEEGILRNFHPFAKLIALVLIMFSSFLVVFFVGILAATLFFDLPSLYEIIEGNIILDSDELISFNKFNQTISHIGLFIVPSIIFAWLIGGRVARYLQINIKPDLRQVFIGICLVFISLPLINFLLHINMQLSLPGFLEPLEKWMVSTEKAAEKITHQFLSVSSLQGLLLNIVIIAVIPAIGEEFIFRGALLNIFKQWTKNTHIAVWITAIIFSTIHFQFFGFLPRLFLGALFGYFVVFSGTIWIAIIAHFINNAAAVTAFYLYHNEILDIQLEEIGKGTAGTYLVVLSTLLVILLLFAMWKIGKIKKNETIYP